MKRAIEHNEPISEKHGWDRRLACRITGWKPVLQKKSGCKPVGLILLSAAFAVPAGGLAGAQPSIHRHSIDGGGEISSTSGGFELSATIGQADAGVLTGGTFSLVGGFWFEQPPGDCNATGTVNLLDYSDLEACLLGPDGGLGTGCECFDFDGDGDNDLLDFAVFQAGFTGP